MPHGSARSHGAAGDAGVCLAAVHRDMELWVFRVVAFCTTMNGGGFVVCYD